MINNKFTLDGLDCAHCAAEIEEKIAQQTEYKNVSVTFANKTLSLDTESHIPTLKQDIQKLVDSVEDGVTVIKLQSKKTFSHKFTLEGLDCAHCAAEIEEKISQQTEYKNVSVTFANKTLSLDIESHVPTLKHDIQKLIDSVEDGITVTEIRSDKKKSNGNEIKLTFIRIACSVVTFGVAIALGIFGINLASAICYGLGTIVVGYPVFLKGIKSLSKLRMDETCLMSIAVVAAFFLGDYFEAGLVALLFTIGEAFEDLAVNKSRKDIEKLAEIRPDTALYSDNGVLTEKPAESINIGDTIVVKPFTRVPLDGVIISGTSSVDTSAITGESVPVPVAEGSEVMSGCINCDGMISIKVTNSFETSTASRILKLVEDFAAQKGSSEKFITKFAKIYTPVVILCAVAVALIPSLINPANATVWIKRALVFLVASCPCAIVISVPLGFYSGIGRASKNGILIKGGKYIEAISKANAVVFDKTGTLTQGKPAVTEVKSTGKMSKEQIISLAAAVEKYSAHPIASAIKAAADEKSIYELSGYSEVPAKGAKAMLNGHAVECGSFRLLSDEESKKYQSDSDGVFLLLDNHVEGIIFVKDIIRDEAPTMCKELKKLGVKRIVMLTGDNESVAKDISNKCGVDDFHASLLPQDKVAKAEKIKEQYGTMIFVGDGINDAPVITLADCGFAMGLGSEAAIESADAVLSDNSLKKLPDAIRLARRTLATVKFNIVFAISIKFIVLLLAVFGYAPIWLAVFADTGVSVLATLNSARLLKAK